MVQYSWGHWYKEIPTEWAGCGHTPPAEVPSLVDVHDKDLDVSPAPGKL